MQPLQSQQRRFAAFGVVVIDSMPAGVEVCVCQGPASSVTVVTYGNNEPLDVQATAGETDDRPALVCAYAGPIPVPARSAMRLEVPEGTTICEVDSDATVTIIGGELTDLPV